MPNLAKHGTPSTAPACAQSQSRTEQAAICFFKKQTYKVTATVGQRRALMRVITPVLDSGAGPNLIHLRSVAEPWRAAIKSVRSPPFIDASNRSMKAIGELKLHVQIGAFCARVPFLVVTNLAVDCILVITFLDRHVKAILPPQRKVLFHHAPSVALTGVTPSRHDRKWPRGDRRSSSRRRKIRLTGSAHSSRRTYRHGKFAWSGDHDTLDDPSDGTSRNTGERALLYAKLPQNGA